MSQTRSTQLSRNRVPSFRRVVPPRAAAGRLRGLRIAIATSMVVMAALLLACGSDADSSTSASAITPAEPTATVESAANTPVSSPSSTATTAAEVDLDSPFVAEGSIDDDVKRMNVTLGSKTYNIKNGGKIVLGGGYAVEIYVDPFPPSTLRSWMDLYLTRDGEPVTEASMGMEYDMLAMLHGPFYGEAEKVGEGHYLFTLDYIMFGLWDQMLTIRINLERIRFPVVLVSYP